MTTTSKDGTYAVKRLCFSVAITARLDKMLGNKFSPCIVDGQFMSNLLSELKDSKGNLTPPSEYRMDECYAQIFDRVLRGQRAIVFVEGERGRGAFARYVKRNGGRAAPITSQFAARLGFEVDMLLDLLSSGCGSICELYIHGVSTFVVLRVSVGSCVFKESLSGAQALHTLLTRLYNQMLLVRLMATRQKLIKYDSTKSSLFDFVTDSEAAKQFTAYLHASKLLSKGNVYLTPRSVRGTVEGNSVAGKKKASELGTKYGPIYGPRWARSTAPSTAPSPAPSTSLRRGVSSPLRTRRLSPRAVRSGAYTLGRRSFGSPTIFGSRRSTSDSKPSRASQLSSGRRSRPSTPPATRVWPSETCTDLARSRASTRIRVLGAFPPGPSASCRRLVLGTARLVTWALRGNTRCTACRSGLPPPPPPSSRTRATRLR